VFTAEISAALPNNRHAVTNINMQNEDNSAKSKSLRDGDKHALLICELSERGFMQPSTRRQARPSKQRNELNRITLVDELKAIEYGDDDYRLKEVRDTIDEDAFHARQTRRSEILRLLATEAPYCPKHSVKTICPKCIASRGGRRTTTKYKDRQLGQDGRAREEKETESFGGCVGGTMVRKDERQCPSLGKL